MNQYFNPDIKSLREVSETVRRDLLGLDKEPAPETAPDLLLVDQLLHMIRFAREAGAAAPAGF